MEVRTVEPAHTGSVGDKDHVGAADEQPAFDHADDAADALLEPGRIGDGGEAAVEYAVTAVGDERLPRRGKAQTGARAQHLERLAGGFQAERNDLDGNRRMGAKTPDQLGAVDDDHQSTARRGHDLLAQQGAAQPLDQVERALLDLVRAVDREVDHAMLCEGRQRNARRLRLGRRPLRRRDADKTQALAMASSKGLDGEARRRAGAEADDHGVPHQPHRRLRRGALEDVAVAHSLPRPARALARMAEMAAL